MSNTLLPFAQGTTEFPTPIQGNGGSLTASTSPVGGNTSSLTPVPKTGFVGRFGHDVTGTLTVGTIGTAYTIPLHRLQSNLTVQNSLAYPYRNLNGDDIWFWANANQGRGSLDAIYGSSTLNMPVVTSTGAKNFQYTWTDEIALNDGVNFSKFLLAALTNSNDLTILVTWLAIGNISTIQQNTTVFSAYTASDAVTCVYQTVPDPSQYYWPDTSVVQQAIGDPSFSNCAVGLNNINLTPISGPEFLGIGLQIVSSGGTLDPMTPAGTYLTQVQLLVGGTIPLKTYTQADLVRFYENRYGRNPNYGYYYIDLLSDLSIPNVMSNTMRKALSTTRYAQLTLGVTLNSNFTTGTGMKIVVFKRTRQSYSGNAAIA